MKSNDDYDSIRFIDSKSSIKRAKSNKKQSLKKRIATIATIAGIASGAVLLGHSLYAGYYSISEKSIEELKDEHSSDISEEDIKMLMSYAKNYKQMYEEKNLTDDELKKETNKYLYISSTILKKQISSAYNKVNENQLPENKVGFFINKDFASPVVGYILDSEESKIYSNKTYLFIGKSDSRAVCNYVDILIDKKKEDYDAKRLLTGYNSLIKASKEKCEYRQFSSDFKFTEHTKKDELER